MSLESAHGLVPLGLQVPNVVNTHIPARDATRHPLHSAAPGRAVPFTRNGSGDGAGLRRGRSILPAAARSLCRPAAPGEHQPPATLKPLCPAVCQKPVTPKPLFYPERRKPKACLISNPPKNHKLVFQNAHESCEGAPRPGRAPPSGSRPPDTPPTQTPARTGHRERRARVEPPTLRQQQRNTVYSRGGRGLSSSSGSRCLRTALETFPASVCPQWRRHLPTVPLWQCRRCLPESQRRKSSPRSGTPERREGHR